MTSLLAKGSLTRYWLPRILTVLLVLPPSALSQAQAQAPAQAPAKPPAQLTPLAPLQSESLRIITLSGNGEINDLQRVIMAPVVVQVLDQDGRPVEGAQVVFNFPVQGPSATFANKQSSQTTRTNADGQAAATGWVANTVGTFQIKVTASLANQTGQTTISMTNATKVVDVKKDKGKSWWSSKWAKIGIIGAAAAVVVTVVLLNRGGTSTTSVTAVPGSPTIGAPQ
jgi:hypothetical protein